MWNEKPIRSAALVCALLVLTAVTAHLVHTAQVHYEHATKGSELACSLCAFSGNTMLLAVFVLPALVLLSRRKKQQSPALSLVVIPARAIVRAPPERG